MSFSASDKSQLKTISLNLRSLLETKQITQAELAKAISVSESAVGKWILGHNAPTMGNVQRIADYFGVPKSAILEEESHQKETTQSFASKKHKVLYDRLQNATEADLEKMERILDLIQEEIDRES